MTKEGQKICCILNRRASEQIILCIHAVLMEHIWSNNTLMKETECLELHIADGDQDCMFVFRLFLPGDHASEMSLGEHYTRSKWT